MEAADRVRGLIEDARGAFHRGDAERTQALATAALSAAQGAGDERLISQSLTWLSRVALRKGDLPEARRLAQEALTVAQRTGDSAPTIGPLHLLAAAARMSGDLAVARRSYEETLRLARETGNVRMATGEVMNIAAVDLLAGDARAAGQGARQALRSAVEQRLPALIAVCLSILGGVALAEGDDARGARLLGAAEAALARSDIVFDPDDQAEHDVRSRAAASRHGPERYRALAAEGGAMPEQVAIELALRDI